MGRNQKRAIKFGVLGSALAALALSISFQNCASSGRGTSAGAPSVSSNSAANGGGDIYSGMVYARSETCSDGVPYASVIVQTSINRNYLTRYNCSEVTPTLLAAADVQIVNGTSPTLTYNGQHLTPQPALEPAALNGLGFNYTGETFGPIGTNVDLYFADFNGDGLADLVGRDKNTGTIYLYKSTGSAFAASGTFGPIGMNVDLYFADFNGDGRDDIIGRDKNTGRIYVYEGSSAGFVSPQIALLGPIGMNIELYVGDINGDGKADIVGRDQYTGQIYIYGSTGSALIGPTLFGPIGENVELYLADVNGDARADLIGRDKNTGLIDIYLANGASFSSSPSGTFGPIGLNVTLSFADIDDDGKVDLVGRDYSTGAVYFDRSTGTSFTVAGSSTVYGPLSSATESWLAPVNPSAGARLITRDDVTFLISVLRFPTVSR